MNQDFFPTFKNISVYKYSDVLTCAKSSKKKLINQTFKCSIKACKYHEHYEETR